jgi:hypothetical protein
MRKLNLLTLLLLFLAVNTRAQQDTSLANRLATMLKMTQSMDLEKILDYTYPKLFTVATREQMTEALKSSFETEEFTSTLDSVKVIKVFPVFTIKDGQYVKIKHTMLMRMKFKEELDSAQEKSIIPLMEENFGVGNIRFDKATNTLVILVNAELVGIKDEFSPDWSFVNYDDGDGSIATMLFSKEVVEKLKEYK